MTQAARSVRGRTWLLLASALLALALLCAVLVHRVTLQRLASAVQQDNVQLAAQVDQSDGEIAGAMVVLGLLDPRIKAVLAGTQTPDAALYEAFMAVIRQFQLDNMQVLDAQGTTLAYVDKEGSHDAVGRSRSVRSFVARALAGLSSRDPMISRTTGTRGIYMSAPVRAALSPQSPVIGMVVVRDGLDHIDRMLHQQADPVMLLSPDGLVYATNRQDWMLKLAEPLSQERELALRQSAQFGKLMATDRPATLPFVFDAGTARIDGVRYDVAEERLDWADEGRGWRLLLLRERSLATEWGAALSVAAAVLLAGLGAALWWLRRHARRMLLEQERTARELQMTHLLESAPGAVIVSSEAGDVLFHNRHAQEMHQVLAPNVRDLYVDPAERSALTEALRRDGHAMAQAVQMRRSDGSTFWAQITLARGVFAHHPDAVFGWAVDVTESRQAAEAMRLAKEAAEAAAATKSAFLANMSHEIRTPMNAIIGLSHLALQTALNPQQSDYIQKVHRAARALLGIVNDILDFSKIEAGKLIIEQADFALDELLGNLATLTAEKAGDKGVELVFEIDEAVPRQLRGDALRLGQVLTNLISNAVKFTEHGEIVLHCALLQPAHGAMALDITVSDTGIGMNAEQVARIFAPFSQADESTTRRFGGTGLGLSISKRLVDAAGGVLALDSTPGQGSHFRFTWPCTLAELPQPAPALPLALQGARALVVTGHARTGAVLAAVLRRAGCTVDQTRDAQQALQLRKASAHRLVFCEQNLPGMPGLALLQALAHDDPAAPAPICILVTATASETLRHTALQAGAAALLLKPVTQSTLMQALASCGHGTVATDTSTAAPDLHGLRVLLVEDNAINQQIATELMHAAGVAVDVADNGRAALERLRASPAAPYDLVLMDLQMPEMDGHEATRRIRADPRLATLPIVAMTAHAMAEERQRCLDEGMNDHLSKPIEPSLLYRVLSQWRPATAAPKTTGRAPAAPAKAKDEAWATRLAAAVPGLQVAAALRRVRGNRGLYAKLLQRYAAEQGQFVTEFSSLLDAGDLLWAARAVHSFKGVSATLGLSALADDAARLEDALASQNPQACRLPLQALGATLAQVLAALQGLSLVPEDAGAVAAPPDPGAALRRLHAMLEDSDGEAHAHMEALSAWLQHRMAAREWAALQKHMDNYAFDEALSVLRAAPGLIAWAEQV